MSIQSDDAAFDPWLPIAIAVAILIVAALL